MGSFFFPQGSGSGGGTFPAAVVYDNRVSPAALAAGTTNDYAPAGLATANVLRITTDASGSTLSGLTAQALGTSIILLNLGPGDLILQDEGGGSLPANRFAMPADFLIPMDYGWSVLYDDSLRWRLW